MLLLNIHSIGKPTIYQTIFSLLLLKKEESPIRNLSTNFLIRNAFYSQYEPHLCQFVSIIFHFYQPSMQKTQMVVIIKKKKKNSSFMTHFSCSRYSDMPQHVWWIGVIFAAFYLGHPTSTLQSFWGCFFFCNGFYWTALLRHIYKPRPSFVMTYTCFFLEHIKEQILSLWSYLLYLVKIKD